MHTHHQRISQVRRWNTELLLHFDLSHKLQLPVIIEFALNLRQFCKQLLQHLLAYHFFVETQHVVGVCILTVDNRPILSLNRKPKSRVESALNPIDLTVLAEYHEQIESNLQRIERKNQRTWYSKPRSEMGVTCVGRQKMKLGSKPLI